MNALAIMIAATTVGVDYGWHRGSDGEWEYIIQIEPALVDTLTKGQALVSQMPPELRGIRRFRIQIGQGEVPREAVPVQGILGTEHGLHSGGALSNNGFPGASQGHRGSTLNLGAPPWPGRDLATSHSPNYDWLKVNPVRIDPLENTLLNAATNPNFDSRAGRGFSATTNDSWARQASLPGSSRNDQGWSPLRPPAFGTASQRNWSRLDDAPDRPNPNDSRGLDMPGPDDWRGNPNWGNANPNSWSMNDRRDGFAHRGQDTRGVDGRGLDSRGFDSRGFDTRDSRGSDSRGYDSRGYDPRRSDARDGHDYAADDRFETRQRYDDRDRPETSGRVASRDRGDSSLDRSRTRAEDSTHFRPNTSHTTRSSRTPTTPTASGPSDRLTADPKAWWPLTTTVVLLFASLGGNFYLGWLAVDFYRRYREAAWELRTSGPPGV